jgi:hypothetical protein
MKSLKEFLTESKKTYKFKIRAAGELPEGFVDKLETALNKYEVVSFSKGKTTPITERPLDFPQLTNCEVTTFDAEVSYPTTSHILESYLTLNTDYPASHLIVRGENEESEKYQEQKEEKEYNALLTTEELGGESAQDQVGDKRVMDLLKELETAKKENKFDPTKGISKEKA